MARFVVLLALAAVLALVTEAAPLTDYSDYDSVSDAYVAAIDVAAVEGASDDAAAPTVAIPGALAAA